MKKLTKTLSIFFVFVFIFALSTFAAPAHAFYLEVPQSLKNLLLSLKDNKTIAQEAPTMNYQTSYPTPPPGGTQTAYPSQPTTNMMPPQGTYQTQPMPPQGTYQTQPMPPQGTQQYPVPTNPGQTCNINGKEMPGSCDQYKQGMPYGDQGMQRNYDQGMQQGGGQQGQGGPSPEQQARQLQDMKRGIKQMERPIKEFERMIQSAEKKGVSVPDEIKQKLEKAKSILEGAKNASTAEDLQNVDMSEMGDIMQSMDDFRRDVMEKQQRVEGMRRGMKGMEQGLKMFEKQIAMLAKKNIAVPADVQDNVSKLRAIIDAVKNAKTSAEIDAIDFDSLQDLMQNMDESRQKLEVLARWPQTLKQIDQQLKQITRELARSKSIVDRLAKKGMDIQSEYTAFADAVNKLKSVRDDAVAKMAAGNSEDAFSALEDDFFGQMDDVWQHQRVIMTMSNLGRFASEFKQGISQANSMVRNLKRKGIDAADAEDLVAQANEKGQEIISLLKAGNIDEDTVTGALDDLENIKQEFEAKVAELTGQEEMMPWEKGPQQFKRVEMSSEMQKFIPQKTVEQTPVQVQAPTPNETGPSGF